MQCIEEITDFTNSGNQDTETYEHIRILPVGCPFTINVCRFQYCCFHIDFVLTGTEDGDYKNIFCRFLKLMAKEVSHYKRKVDLRTNH